MSETEDAMAMPQPTPPEPGPSEVELALRQAQAENRQLRATVKAMESALRTAAKVMQPYVDRTIAPSDTPPLPRRHSWVR
jgi:hypothetical protein